LTKDYYVLLKKVQCKKDSPIKKKLADHIEQFCKRHDCLHNKSSGVNIAMDQGGEQGMTPSALVNHDNGSTAATSTFNDNNNNNKNIGDVDGNIGEVITQPSDVANVATVGV
jgi:hypothetical protein